MNEIVRQIVKDFMDDDLPEVFERDLSLDKLQVPAKGNVVNVVVGVRRCGKTYRLYQEMHRIVAAGYPRTSILYFNFEDERLKPYDAGLLDDVVSAFFSLNPAARHDGCFMFFDEIQEVPEWDTFLRRMVDTQRATIYVSGSSSKMLSAQLASAFRGRSLSRELFPMGFSEYVRYRGLLAEVPARAQAEDGLSSREEDAPRAVSEKQATSPCAAPKKSGERRKGASPRYRGPGSTCAPMHGSWSRGLRRGRSRHRAAEKRDEAAPLSASPRFPDAPSITTPARRSPSPTPAWPTAPPR